MRRCGIYVINVKVRKGTKTYEFSKRGTKFGLYTENRYQPTTMRKTSIKSKVLRILKNEGSISNHDCIDNKLTTRLSDVIFRLRNEGYDITVKKVPHSRDYVYTLHREILRTDYVPELDLKLKVYK